MRTRRTAPLRSSALALLVCLMPFVTAGDGLAQTHRAAVSLVGGGSTHSDLTPGLGTATVFEPGWLAGLQVEGWLAGGWAGLRLNSHFTQRLLEGGQGDYNVYAADVDLLVRPLHPTGGRRLAPYVGIGAGATHYASVTGSPLFAGGAYGDEPVLRAHALVSLGADLRTGAAGALRLEVADKIVFPSVGESPPSTGLPMSHNLVLVAGVQLRLGDPAPRVVVADEPRATAAEAAAPPASVRVSDEPPATTTPATGRYTVQVADWVEAPTAARWAGRLRARGVPVWLIPGTIRGRRVDRVRVGVLGSEADARRLAAALEREYGWEVQVDRIGADEDYPADAGPATLSFLQSR